MNLQVNSALTPHLFSYVILPVLHSGISKKEEVIHGGLQREGEPPACQSVWKRVGRDKDQEHLSQDSLKGQDLLGSFSDAFNSQGLTPFCCNCSVLVTSQRGKHES